MSPSSRDGSRDRSESRMVKHQHSFSESGRSSIPMWDSSDPDRAPPPLPLNPAAAGSPLTRSNTSARIEEAAALITARVRENAPSSYTSNPPPSPSPDKSMMKPHHRRMQSVQPNNVARLSDSLERRSPDKGLRQSRLQELEDYRAGRKTDRSPNRLRSETPTPTSKVTGQEENTPPTNMLALQTVRSRQESQPPLSDITNGVLPNGPGSLSFDALSSQILNITTIATNLQREMANLSKRSKDNASDLVSLKEATNARDEDIRKSLRDLVAGLDVKFTTFDPKFLTGGDSTRSATSLGFMLDDKPYNSTPNRKNINLPRMPSPASFAAGLDRDLTASPSLACVDGAASIALLEKVLREMGTRDGQDRIMNTLDKVRSDVLARNDSHHRPENIVDPIMMTKLEDILSLMREMKDNSVSKALVRSNENGKAQNHVSFYIEGESGPGPVTKTKDGSRRLSNAATPNADFVNEEVMKMLKSVKQSLSQGGGLTNEVKALVRELRGEVLGMGREIARKLEQTEVQSRSAQTESQGARPEEIADIVGHALAELKEHMHEVVRDNRRQSAASNRSVIDTQEVVHAVRNALTEMKRSTPEPTRDPVAEREELIAAVKVAWEDCKPDIALEHFGLERDEILETLKEGLKSYTPNETSTRDVGASYEDVLDAVKRGLSDFKPPQIQTEAGITREELLVTVRECLESVEWPRSSPSTSELSTSSLSRREVVEAVKEGLTYQTPVSKEVEFNREDLFDAIRSCLEGEQNPLGGMGERVVEAMHEFLGSMKTEFQQYSAANGKDTEQVLDALKDGLEDLRADVESYVDRAADVTGKDEIIDTVKAGFAAMQADLDRGLSSRNNQQSANTPELLDAMEKEFQHLRDTINKSMPHSDSSSHREEILDAIRDIADDRHSSLSSNSEDVVRLVKEELEHMRLALAGTLVKSGSSIQRDDVVEAVREGLESHRGVPRPDGNESILSNTSELLDAFQDGVDGIRADLQKVIDRPADLNNSYEILDALKTGIEDVRADIQRLQDRQTDSSEASNPRDRAVVVHDENMISTELEGLKVMITQLRIKVEALDTLGPTPSTAAGSRMHKDDLDELHSAIRDVHASVKNVRNTSVPEMSPAGNAASKDDIDAIETLLRNMKAKVDDINMSSGDSIAKTSHLDAIEDMLRDIKILVEDSSSRTSDSSSKIDLELTELMIRDVQKGVEDLQSKFEKLSTENQSFSKTEIEVVESLCMDIKAQIADLPLPNLETLPTKGDVAEMRDSLKAFRDQFEADNELTAQAFEARKVEHGGLATKIDDVRGLIGDLRDELIGKLDGSEEGIIELNKVLGMHHDNMTAYATAASLTELSELVKGGHDRHMEHLNNSKAAMEERDVTLFDKHEETTMVLRATIEDKFNEIMTKYDDAQQYNNAKLEALQQRENSHLETANGTKAVVDDMKSLMETLGSTVTETCDRMSDDAKTVFGKVDDASVKIGELHSANALEHGQTRDEIAKTLVVASRLEGSMAEHQPVMMNVIREILGIVGQHYQHSQQQTESFARATEEIKSGVNSIPATIPSFLPALTAAPSSPPLVREIPVSKEYDDSQVHDKLNNLISHAAVAKEAFANIEKHHKSTQETLCNVQKLDDIHEQVLVAASEISALVATQTRLMGDHHDSKTAEATEAAIALEKRTAQKERVEADIVALTEEKDALIKSMATLRREHEELSGQTKRLTREVAKLETALNIRHEEMRDMNHKAETLERRILEGLMNHARSVKIGKPKVAKKISPAERDASMNLKRVPSSASTITTKISTKDSATIGGAVEMALKKRTPLTSSNSVSSRASNVDRRILSSSHVTGNRGRDTPERALVLAPAPKTGLVSLKRSHSVKSNPLTYIKGRKQSWNGVVSTIVDKENVEHDEHGSDGDDLSDAGTERRTSTGGTSYMYTDSLMYGTGSSVSGGGRTASYASSVGGTINGQTESIAEEEEEEVHEQSEPANQYLIEQAVDNVEAGQDNSMALTTFEGLDAPTPAPPATYDGYSDLQLPPLITGNDLKYHQGSDSGLGTEPPTADYERVGEALEYFQMSAQEMRSDV